MFKIFLKKITKILTVNFSLKFYSIISFALLSILLFFQFDRKIEFDLDVEKSGQVQLFLDDGNGFLESHSKRIQVSQGYNKVSFRLPFGYKKDIRLDPIDNNSNFTISRLRITSSIFGDLQNIALPSLVMSKSLITRKISSDKFFFHGIIISDSDPNLIIQRKYFDTIFLEKVIVLFSKISLFLYSIALILKLCFMYLDKSIVQKLKLLYQSTLNASKSIHWISIRENYGIIYFLLIFIYINIVMANPVALNAWAPHDDTLFYN
jgi:hypothetical protein